MRIDKNTVTNALSTWRTQWQLRRQHKAEQASKTRKIIAFEGERELLRKPTVLVTDTRLAFIDPFDRMLKTYMFEHMISVHKQYYRPTAFIRRFCKALILFGILLLLITLIIDLLDTDSRGFVLVYIPAFLSLVVGFLVWRDMRPKYKIEWKMRDGSTDKLATELLLRDWLLNSKKREIGMDNIAQAINEALSTKAWVPANNGIHSHGEQEMLTTTIGMTGEPGDSEPADTQTGKRQLRLVTDHYQ